MSEIIVDDQIFIRQNWIVEQDLEGWIKCMDDINQLRHLDKNILPVPYSNEMASENILQNKNYCDEQLGKQDFCVQKLNLPIIYRNQKTSSNQLIGAILIRPAECLKYSFESVEIGYVLDPAFQRKGIMSKSIKKFIDFVFDRFSGIKELTAIISDENVASLKLVKRLGQRSNIMQKNGIFVT